MDTLGITSSTPIFSVKNLIIPIGLSYYEMIAASRQITDISKISLSSNQIECIIKDVFKCGICLSIFNDPVNIKSCLHKFCKRCIEDYNRKEKKECAICRSPIETRRHMMDDSIMKKISKFRNIFSNLVSCFITNIKLFNEQEENDINLNIKNWYFDINKAYARSEVKLGKPGQSSEKLKSLETEVESSSRLKIANTDTSKAQKETTGLKLTVIKCKSTDEEANQSEKNLGKKRLRQPEKQEQYITVELRPKKKKENSMIESRLVSAKNSNFKQKIYFQSNSTIDIVSKYIKFKHSIDMGTNVKLFFESSEDELPTTLNLSELQSNWERIKDRDLSLDIQLCYDC